MQYETIEKVMHLEFLSHILLSCANPFRPLSHFIYCLLLQHFKDKTKELTRLAHMTYGSCTPVIYRLVETLLPTVLLQQ